jgi:hypothetical protein
MKNFPYASESPAVTLNQMKSEIIGINKAFDGVDNLLTEDMKVMYNTYLNKLHLKCYEVLTFLGYDLYDMRYGSYNVYDRRTGNMVKFDAPKVTISVSPEGNWTQYATGYRVSIYFVLDLFKIEPNFRWKRDRDSK